MTDLPVPKAARLQRPGGVTPGCWWGCCSCSPRSPSVPSSWPMLDDRTAVYAARGPLVPGQRLTDDDLGRVDVQLGTEQPRYLAATSGLAPERFVLRRVAGRRAVPAAAVGGRSQVAVQPLVLSVDAGAAAALQVGLRRRRLRQPGRSGGRPGGRRLRRPRARAEGVSVSSLPARRGGWGGAAGDRPVQVMAPTTHQGDHRRGRPGARVTLVPVPAQRCGSTSDPAGHRRPRRLGESELVAAVGATAGYTVARRCADLADLLAAAAAGHGEIALVSADLRALDRPALHELATHGVEAAGVVGPVTSRGSGGCASSACTWSCAPTSPATSSRTRSTPSRRPAAGARCATRRAATRVSRRGARRRRARRPRSSRSGGRPAPPVAARSPSTSPPSWPAAPTLLVDCDTYGSSVAQALGLLDEAPGIAAAARAADQGALDLRRLARLAPEVPSCAC